MVHGLYALMMSQPSNHYNVVHCQYHDYSQTIPHLCVCVCVCVFTEKVTTARAHDVLLSLMPSSVVI